GQVVEVGMEVENMGWGEFTQFLGRSGRGGYAKQTLRIMGINSNNVADHVESMLETDTYFKDNAAETDNMELFKDNKEMRVLLDKYMAFNDALNELGAVKDEDGIYSRGDMARAELYVSGIVESIDELNNMNDETVGLLIEQEKKDSEKNLDDVMATMDYSRDNFGQYNELELARAKVYMCGLGGIKTEAEAKDFGKQEEDKKVLKQLNKLLKDADITDEVKLNGVAAFSDTDLMVLISNYTTVVAKSNSILHKGNMETMGKLVQEPIKNWMRIAKDAGEERSVELLAEIYVDVGKGKYLDANIKFDKEKVSPIKRMQRTWNSSINGSKDVLTKILNTSGISFKIEVDGKEMDIKDHVRDIQKDIKSVSELKDVKAPASDKKLSWATAKGAEEVAQVFKGMLDYVMPASSPVSSSAVEVKVENDKRIVAVDHNKYDNMKNEEVNRIKNTRVSQRDNIKDDIMNGAIFAAVVGIWGLIKSSIGGGSDDDKAQDAVQNRTQNDLNEKLLKELPKDDVIVKVEIPEALQEEIKYEEVLSNYAASENVSLKKKSVSTGARLKEIGNNLNKLDGLGVQEKIDILLENKSLSSDFFRTTSDEMEQLKSMGIDEKLFSSMKGTREKEPILSYLNEIVEDVNGMISVMKEEGKPVVSETGDDILTAVVEYLNDQGELTGDAAGKLNIIKNSDILVDNMPKEDQAQIWPVLVDMLVETVDQETPEIETVRELTLQDLGLETETRITSAIKNTGNESIIQSDGSIKLGDLIDVLKPGQISIGSTAYTELNKAISEKVIETYTAPGSVFMLSGVPREDIKEEFEKEASSYREFIELPAVKVVSGEMSETEVRQTFGLPEENDVAGLSDLTLQDLNLGEQVESRIDTVLRDTGNEGIINPDGSILIVDLVEVLSEIAPDTGSDIVPDIGLLNISDIPLADLNYSDAAVKILVLDLAGKSETKIETVGDLMKNRSVVQGLEDSEIEVLSEALAAEYKNYGVLPEVGHEEKVNTFENYFNGESKETQESSVIEAATYNDYTLIHNALADIELGILATSDSSLTKVLPVNEIRETMNQEISTGNELKESPVVQLAEGNMTSTEMKLDITASVVLETPVTELGLPSKLEDKLAASEITTVGDIVDKDKGLSEVKGLKSDDIETILTSITGIS
ncbi:MAG: hypothetical protein GY861_00125, partial [bacterium]|nr:hypothetical protein [bacterium]